MEEDLIYQDYQRVFNNLKEQQINQFNRKYDKYDLEGFKLMFPIDEPLPKENEYLPF